jgi:hypothetical protein
MPKKSLTSEQVLNTLAATPSRLAALTAALTPAQLLAAPAPDEWSARDVLAHLRSCADVWGDCITAILAADSPTLKAINPTTWIDQTTYRELAFQPSFDAFTTQRAELLTILEPLPPADWARTATITGAGKPLERTVQLYAQWLARHEQPHIKQIDRLVKALGK